MSQPGGEIVIVGVCAAGKSTLAQRLREAGRSARTVAQEHSFVPELWRRRCPSTTVYLHASYLAVLDRRGWVLSPHTYDAQLHRLRSARAEATCWVDTSHLTPEQVFRYVEERIAGHEDEEASGETPAPVADEPGSDAQPTHPVSAPVPDEPGAEAPEPRRYEGLPIPEEL